MKTVTPAQFRKMREALGYSQERVAKTFGVLRLTVLRWENGRNAIPGSAQLLMRAMYDLTVLRDYINEFHLTR